MLAWLSEYHFILAFPALIGKYGHHAFMPNANALITFVISGDSTDNIRIAFEQML